MMARYHLLLSRSDKTAPWQSEFGAYERGDVTAERDHYRDCDHKASNLKILTINSAAQSCVRYAVDRLNGKI